MPNTTESIDVSTCGRCRQSQFTPLREGIDYFGPLCELCDAHICAGCDQWCTELFEDTRCESCTATKVCDGCDERKLVFAPDDMCIDCTDLHVCDRCDNFVEHVDHRSRCVSCSDLGFCGSCLEFTEGCIYSDSRCEDCSVYSSCGNCGEETENSEYCDSCEESDDDDDDDGNDREEGASVETSLGKVSHKVPAVPSIMRMGIELEGSWDTRPPAGDNFVGDSSVKVRRGDWKRGEIPSDVLRPQMWESVAEFITENYPDHVGPSCGLHVHFSFGDAGRMRELREYFRTKRNLDFLLARLERWGKRHSIYNDSFYSRLRGENTYCKVGEWRSGDRYHAMNFESLHEHGTIEIRVLSAFYQSSAALSAIAELAHIMSRLHSVVLRQEARDIRNAREEQEARDAFESFTLADQVWNTTNEHNLMLQEV